jgi:uncharacterized protein
MKRWFAVLVFAGVVVPYRAEGRQIGLPIIDMHFHGALSFNEQVVQPIEPWLAAFDERGVRKAVLTSFPHQLAVWTPMDVDRFIPSLWFPCVTQFVQDCFPGDELLPDIGWLRAEIEAGRIEMLGEVATELFGIFPGAPELEPYFSLAEEFDIPFGLHMGPGPAWAVTEGSIYAGFPDFEIAAGNPLELEDVLRRHPNLRLYLMHAGWPMLDELLTVLWHNPGVYVDLGHLQVAIPRAEYYSYLRRIVEAGYGDRVMYGSDVGLNDFGSGIDAVLAADFLSSEQKRDILYNNAARFLRLGN